MSDESAANAATGLRVDDRELTMAEVTTRIKAIEDMMHPLIPLVDQVAALAIAIAQQTEQQRLTNTGLLRLERNQGRGCAAANGANFRHR